MGKPLPDAELLSANAQDKIAELIGVMVPFVSLSKAIVPRRPVVPMPQCPAQVTYLNSIVMPDPVDEESVDSTGSEVTTEDID
ncbi:hypothetical protein Plec18167_003103 [Paecilomyces lecythidis]|uniref:Uncharacterized protein n=1 Tax=Paecilomyces lecythidis TaxID=3004212 RepID=A0ABR3XZP8_9EURO